ncbi:histamine H2 receptor [Nematostella vectensis]|uniref:histamine H2 receptor n=1 Tax=Nematostella vectensis TaxID=45351 RepID=UPI0013905E9E|nr:histamine H2 receptor [Nematostella vectensis]
MNNSTSHHHFNLANSTIQNGSRTSTDSSYGIPTSFVVVFSFLLVLSLLIIATNSSVIYFVASRRYLKTSTNIALASLAASDLLTGLLAIPLIVTCNIHHKVCLAMDITSRFIAYSTVLHLLVVTLERYIMIVHAMKYKLWITKKRTSIVLTSVWVFSAATSFIQLSWVDLKNPNDPTDSTLKKDLVYDLICFAGIVLMSLVLIAFALSSVFLVLRRQARNIKKLNSSVERSCRTRAKRIQCKAAITFAGMLLAFIICWFTYFLEGIRNDLQLEALKKPFWADVVLVFMRFATAIVNPLLYALIKKDFKRVIRLPSFSFDRSTPPLPRNALNPENNEAEDSV